MNAELENLNEIVTKELSRGQRRPMSILEDCSQDLTKEQIKAEVDKFEKKLSDINSVRGEQMV